MLNMLNGYIDNIKQFETVKLLKYSIFPHSLVLIIINAELFRNAN